MKNIATIISFMLAMACVSCGHGLQMEKVITRYENGQPSKVYYYDREGNWVREIDYYENGFVMMDGRIENDLRNGEWTSYFLDGKVQSSGEFKDGLRVGKAKVYYENGHLWMDGSYVDDHKCGEWIFYDEQGYETTRVNYGPCD